MKNFLLAVALLSIGTAVAGPNDRFTYTKKQIQHLAKEGKQLVTEKCIADLQETAIATNNLDAYLTSDRYRRGKEVCECTGKKYENYINRNGPLTDISTAQSVMDRHAAECIAAEKRKYRKR